MKLKFIQLVTLACKTTSQFVSANSTKREVRKVIRPYYLMEIIGMRFHSVKRFTVLD